MKSLKEKAISGFKWTGIFSVVNLVISPLVIIFLGYYLSHEEFGQKSIVNIIINLSITITQFGIAQAIIQKKKVANNELSSLFWGNIIIGIIMFISLYLLSYPVSIFYNDSELLNLVKIASFIFLLEPIGLIFNALLEKEMKFKLITILNLIKVLILNSLLITFVYFGFGVYSFVFSNIIAIIIYLIILIITFTRDSSWRPTLRFNIFDLKEYYNFGIYVTGKNALNYLSRNFDEIIIGKIMGVEVLGIYHFAKQLVDKVIILITSTNSKILYPLFSKVRDDINTNRFNMMYLKLTKIISVLCFPLLGLFIIIVPFLVDFLFGVKWIASTTLIQILLVKGFIDILSAGFSSGALYAFNKPKWVFTVELILTPIRFITLLIGSLISLEVVAVSFVMIVLLKASILQILVNKVSGLQFQIYIRQLKFPFLITISLTIISLLLNELLNNLLNTTFFSCLYLAAYLMFIILLEKASYTEIITEVKNIFKRNISNSPMEK